MRQDEAYIEHLEVDAIKTLAERIYKNRPEHVTLPETYDQTTTPSPSNTESIPENILTDDTIHEIKAYMENQHISDFTTAVNQLIHKGLRQD